MKQVITAQDIPEAGELKVLRGAIITPAARELAASRAVRLLEVSPEDMPAAPPERTLALAADHGGYRLKDALKPILVGLGFTVRDLGYRRASRGTGGVGRGGAWHCD